MKKDMLLDVKTLFVTCRQFGDTGKGKFVDLFAEWANIIVRGTGGDNAGHTICFEGKKLVTHIIPSGICFDNQGKINIVGSGTVLYPKVILNELKNLEEMGISHEHLLLAYNAKLITPAEIVLDRVRESVAGKGKIGSTGKGIAPAYADFIDRQGLILNDVINPNIFNKKLKRHLQEKKTLLKNYSKELIREIMVHEHLEYGAFYNYRNTFNLDSIYDKYVEYGRALKPFISDTDYFVKQSLGKLNILGEGAQGDLLSVKNGTYPFVTSSDCGVAGLAEGMGLQKCDVDLSLGIIKGFYMSRVGCGPFPTEIGGDMSDDWCNSGQVDKRKEQSVYGRASVDDEDEFLQGIAMRREGDEFGATTGRPRRVGWLDLPLLRYVLTFNSPDIILTKLDILNKFKVIKICNEYEYVGPKILYAGREINPGDRLRQAIPYAEVLEHCRPIYTCFPGWQSELKDCSTFKSLPQKLKDILAFVVKETGIRPRIISIGPDRKETIYL